MGQAESGYIVIKRYFDDKEGRDNVTWVHYFKPSLLLLNMDVYNLLLINSLWLLKYFPILKPKAGAMQSFQ